MAGSTVDGLVSGLSTSSLIEQFMQIEARGQTALTTKVSAHQRVIDAYQAVNSKFAALKTSASELSKASAWTVAKATSSATDVISATASAGAVPSSVDLVVTQLATRESWVSSTAVAGTAVVASGSVTVTKNGQSVTLTPSDSSLHGVVSAINGADAGVTAAAVQTAPGQYRLQLTSTTSGAAGGFTVSGIDGLTMTEVGSGGQDAVVSVGGWGTVTSSSNTFTDVLPGVTFTALTTGSATVSVAPDTDKLATSVAGLVAAANATLEQISALSAYDAVNRKGGPLTGDAAVRGLSSSVLSAVSTALGGRSAADFGISTNRQGTLEFHRETFLATMQADPLAVQRAMTHRGAWTDAGGTVATAGTVELLSGTVATKQSSGYGIVVTAAATRASLTLDAAAAAYDGTETITVTRGSVSVTYAVPSGATRESVASGLSGALADAGLAIGASTTGATGIQLTASAYGSGPSFSVTVNSGFSGSGNATGTNVAGTINGVAATGSGQTLALTSLTDDASGLSVLVTLTAADLAAQTGGTVSGTMSFEHGFAHRLAALADQATSTSTGLLTGVIEGRRQTVADLEKQIQNWDVRLDMRRAALQKQFSNLEIMLGRMQSQSSWLAGQISGLPGNQK